MAIGKNTICRAAEMATGHLENYTKDINEAYHECENQLTVNLPVKFSPDPHGRGVKVEVGISFTRSKIKDTDFVVIDENQANLPGID
jgi:hypothetical protein